MQMPQGLPELNSNGTEATVGIMQVRLVKFPMELWGVSYSLFSDTMVGYNQSQQAVHLPALLVNLNRLCRGCDAICCTINWISLCQVAPLCGDKILIQHLEGEKRFILLLSFQGLDTGLVQLLWACCW